jgi:hypothetical membrane protein
MRFVLLGLSVLAILMASRRFYRSEHVGYDVGALFLLLIGIQLLVAAGIFHEHHESRTRKPSASDKNQDDTKNDATGNQ